MGLLPGLAALGVHVLAIRGGKPHQQCQDRKARAGRTSATDLPDEVRANVDYTNSLKADSAIPVAARRETAATPPCARQYRPAGPAARGPPGEDQVEASSLPGASFLRGPAGVV